AATKRCFMSIKRTNLKVAIVQQANSDSVEDNLKRLQAGIEKAAGLGAELVVLQELHNTRYFCQSEDTKIFDLAESIPGPSTELFGKIAKANKVVIVSSLFERRAPGVYH